MPPRQPAVTISKLRKAVAYLEQFRGDSDRKKIAAALGKSKSGLRKLLAPIEARLDVALAERDEHSKDKLAPLAEEFLASARRLLDDYDALFSPRAFGGRRVRVGAYPSVAALFLTRRVLPALVSPGHERAWAGSPEPFQAKFPLCLLDWAAVFRPEIISGVESGTFDFGIVDRDATQAGEPTTGGFVWSELFGCGPSGFLYHQDNRSFAKVAEQAGQFSVSSLREQTLILSRFDFRAAKDSLLPDPSPGRTRCYVGSYREVYEAVRVDAGVGVGFPPNGLRPDGPVQFLPFAAVRCRSQRDQETVRRLKARGISTFGVYVRKDWSRPQAKGGLSDAAKFVLKAVQAIGAVYTHNYVSDPAADVIDPAT
jgi:DNA-binding transcriptional LysR family regulator